MAFDYNLVLIWVPHVKVLLIKVPLMAPPLMDLLVTGNPGGPLPVSHPCPITCQSRLVLLPFIFVFVVAVLIKKYFLV